MTTSIVNGARMNNPDCESKKTKIGISFLEGILEVLEALNESEEICEHEN